MGGQVVIRGYAVHWAAFCSCAEAPPHEHSGNSLEIKAAFILHAGKKLLEIIIGRNVFVADA